MLWIIRYGIARTSVKLQNFVSLMPPPSRMRAAGTLSEADFVRFVRFTLADGRTSRENPYPTAD
jgi:hypothetical protein